MRLRLVLAGNQQQFLNWLSAGEDDSDCRCGHRHPGDYRPLWREQDFLGLCASDVASLDQVGAYWNNAMWGSNYYRGLMETGLSFDLHWAMPWEADFLRAEVLRRGHDWPVTPEEEAAMAAAGAEIDRMLSGSEIGDPEGPMV